MEAIIAALASAGFIIIAIGIFFALLPYLFMIYMCIQMKKIYRKLDTISRKMNHGEHPEIICSEEPEAEPDKKRKGDLSRGEIIFFSIIIGIALCAAVAMLLTLL